MKNERIKAQRAYPRSAANLIWQNRLTVLGGLLTLAVPGSKLFPEDAELLQGAALLTASAGFFLLGVTQFGMGTVGAYRRTIDAFRRTRRVPEAYAGKFEDMYCAERGFEVAIKDIRSGKVKLSE
jgi:hypothetical protein